jgi:hypothetical protein
MLFLDQNGLIDYALEDFETEIAVWHGDIHGTFLCEQTTTSFVHISNMKQ